MLNHYHCPQKIEIGYIGTEDCLRVNVYVPTEAKKPLPVMVYIHGGAFMFGSGGRMMAGPELLLKHDVILVTLNYRLGALGFLCLGIEEAPGNAGLKDQIAALKWVKKNIAAFGGDPDNITLFGHSAGAVSTSILLASDAAHGLFHRAIAQSGAAVGFMTNIDAVKIASSVAKYFGYDTENPKDLFKVLSEVPIKDLVTYTSVAFEPIIKSVRSNLMFGPCVEKIIPGIEPVYVELPSDIISKNPGNVPVIYGFTNREGYYLTILETDESLKKYNESLFDFPDFEFPTKTEAESTLKKLKKLYFGDKDVSRETRNNLDDLYGDYYFKAPTILESELKVSIGNASIYNYHFTYAGWRNLVKGFYGRDLSGPGASHGDDILYTFTSFIWPFPIFKRDQRIINWMTKLWTNFAKYGYVYKTIKQTIQFYKYKNTSLYANANMVPILY